jgi:hypothetical protein
MSFAELTKKSDDDLLFEYLDGQKGSESSENAKFILETRNAKRLSGYSDGLVKVTKGLQVATWVLVFFTLIQASVQIVNLFKR